MKYSVWFVCLLSFLSEVSLSHAEAFNAAFEPLPPHIEANGQGLLPALLEQLASSSNDSYSIEMVPYSRAKRELQNGRADLIGFTPLAAETNSFYSFAMEVRWPYPVATDFIALTPDRLDDIAKRRVGIPYGNESFAEQMLGIPPENLYLAELDELILMLLRGRLDLVWFERRALHQALLKHPDRPAIHYRQQPPRPIYLGIAVRRTGKGERLKQFLQHGINQQSMPLLSEEDRKLGMLPLRGELPAAMD